MGISHQARNTYAKFNGFPGWVIMSSKSSNIQILTDAAVVENEPIYEI